MNYDQANYSNLAGLGGSVLCTSITPLEKNLLATRRERWLNSKFVTRMSVKRQEVISGEHNSSFKEFLGEYHYIIQQDSVVNSNKIMLARDNKDLRRIVREGGIGMVLTIEGAHTLFGQKVLNNVENIRKSGCDDACITEILSNIDTLRSLSHKIFFITAAHFSWNKMFGNAKSLDKPGMRRGLLTVASLSDGFKNSVLAKFGEGIIGDIHDGQYMDTAVIVNNRKVKVKLPKKNPEKNADPGYRVIKKLLDAENDYQRPIYVDVKHMDLKARFQYYQFIDSLNAKRRKEGKKTIPVVASHIGLSGKKRPVAMATGLFPVNDSYEELIFGSVFYKIQADEHDGFWRAYTQLLQPEEKALYWEHYDPEVHRSFNPFQGNINLNTSGWFYPWSINFCDEEIRHIYDSDGIIGLNMDRRILGFTMPNYSKRYKTNLREKFRYVFSLRYKEAGKKNPVTFKEYYLTEPLLRNIFHVIEVCGIKNASAWDHLAIGSDYDGFIQPVKLAPAAEYIPDFHRKMEICLELFAEIHNKKEWLYGLTPKEVIQKFFYTNGRDFIYKYF